MTKKHWKDSMEKHGTSYKRGTIFFPKELKENTYLLYAYVRRADNVVDDSWVAGHEAKKELFRLHQLFHAVYGGEKTDDSLTQEFSQLCHDYEIPTDWVDSFFEAMIADCSESFYQTYEQLQHYMVGSAEVIGLMMCKLIGYDKTEEEEVFTHARLLGEAMQYTNFLRDVKEDWLMHNRVYMPLDRLQEFDCNHECVKRFCEWADINESRERFMAAQINSCTEQYIEANKWILKLNKQWRFAVLVSSRLYQAILDKIRRNQYDVFNRDAHTTKFEKFTVFMKTLFSHDK